MSKILRFEFYKLSKLKSFYICTLITLIFTVLNAISTYMIAKTNYVDFEEMGVDVPLSYTGWTYSLSAIANSQFLTVFGVFIAMFVCSEFDDNIIKNIYSRGISRTGVFVSKYFASLVAMIVMFVADAVLGFGVGALLWQVGDVGNYFVLIATQLAVLVGYHGLFFFVSIWITKTGGAIAINVVYPTLTAVSFTLLDKLLNIDGFKFYDFTLECFYTNVQNINLSGDLIARAAIVPFIFAAIFALSGALINTRKQV